jgi:hypothetical protein
MGIKINLPPAVEILGRLGKLNDLADTWEVASADGELTGDEFVDLVGKVAEVLAGKTLADLKLDISFLPNTPDAA